jgi:ribonuclease P protein component
MLKKKERIPRKVFNTVFPQAKVLYRGSFFMVRKAESPVFQASVVISKKVAKKATERNSIKRNLYRLLAEYKKNHPNTTGLYIHHIHKKPIQNKDIYDDFQKVYPQ